MSDPSGLSALSLSSVFIEFGADFKAKDQKDKTPRDYARGFTAAFDKAADVLVYDVLSSRVRRHLEDYAHLPVWDAPAEPSGGAGFEMPTFSAYPQACVTAVGEYLLMLPQQFEPLLGAGPSSPVGAPASSGGDVDDTRLASEWVARARGSGAVTLGRCQARQGVASEGSEVDSEMAAKPARSS